MLINQSRTSDRIVDFYHIVGLMLGEEHKPGKRHSFGKRVAINLYKLVVNSYIGLIDLTFSLTMVDHYFPSTLSTKTITKKILFCFSLGVITLDIIKIIVLKNGNKIIEEMRDLMRIYKHLRININSVLRYLVFKSMHFTCFLIIVFIEIYQYQVR